MGNAQVDAKGKLPISEGEVRFDWEEGTARTKRWVLHCSRGQALSPSHEDQTYGRTKCEKETVGFARKKWKWAAKQISNNIDEFVKGP